MAALSERLPIKQSSWITFMAVPAALSTSWRPQGSYAVITPCSRSWRCILFWRSFNHHALDFLPSQVLINNNRWPWSHFQKGSTSGGLAKGVLWPGKVTQCGYYQHKLVFACKACAWCLLPGCCLTWWAVGDTSCDISSAIVMLRRIKAFC